MPKKAASPGGGGEKGCRKASWRRYRRKGAASRDKNGPNPYLAEFFWNQRPQAGNVVCVQRSSVALLTMPAGKGDPHQFQKAEEGFGEAQRGDFGNIIQVGGVSRGS